MTTFGQKTQTDTTPEDSPGTVVDQTSDEAKSPLQTSTGLEGEDGLATAKQTKNSEGEGELDPGTVPIKEDPEAGNFLPERPTLADVTARYTKTNQRIGGVDAYELPACSNDESAQSRAISSMYFRPGDRITVYENYYSTPNSERPRAVPYCTYIASEQDPSIGELASHESPRSFGPNLTTVDGQCPAAEPFIAAGRRPMIYDASVIHGASGVIFEPGDEVDATVDGLGCQYTVTQEDIDIVNAFTAPLRNSNGTDGWSDPCVRAYYEDPDNAYDRYVTLLNDSAATAEQLQTAYRTLQASYPAFYEAHPETCGQSATPPPGEGPPSEEPPAPNPGHVTPQPVPGSSEIVTLGHSPVVVGSPRSESMTTSSSPAPMPGAPAATSHERQDSALYEDAAYPRGGVDAGDGSTAPSDTTTVTATAAAAVIALTGTSAVAYSARRRSRFPSASARSRHSRGL